jgi:hypothetical protein
MDRKPANSRAIAEYGYDAATQTMEVAFPPKKSGESGLYSYTPVTPETMAEIESAESFGVAFGVLVKNNPSVTCTLLGQIVLEPRETAAAEA